MVRHPTEKEVPQPHIAVAFGFLTTNIDPAISSCQSIWESFSNATDITSITTEAPFFSRVKSSGLVSVSSEKAY